MGVSRRLGGVRFQRLTHAQETGNCSFCHRELTDAPSVFAGYGPVCAAKRGLPWGEVAAPELEEVTS